MQSSELDIPDITKEETIGEPDRKESIQNIIPFWSDNPNILLSNDFMFELFPVEAMSFEQKLNAISRTVILLSLVTVHRRHFTLLHIHVAQIQTKRSREKRGILRQRRYARQKTF